MLFVDAETIYTHLANIREAIGARNSFEMLSLLHAEKDNAMPTIRLSPRGKEVFALLLQGLNNAAIGGRLGMGVNGVKRHREKMLLQNGCKSILELIAKYHGTGGENPHGKTE